MSIQLYSYSVIFSNIQIKICKGEFSEVFLKANSAQLQLATTVFAINTVIPT